MEEVGENCQNFLSFHHHDERETPRSDTHTGYSGLVIALLEFCYS